jgi:hypothetical protein
VEGPLDANAEIRLRRQSMGERRPLFPRALGAKAVGKAACFREQVPGSLSGVRARR